MQNVDETNRSVAHVSASTAITARLQKMRDGI